MEIKRIGSQPSNKGPADWFSGIVCGLISVSDHRSGAGGTGRAYVRAGSADGVAYASAGADADCDGGVWTGAAHGRPELKKSIPGMLSGSAGREALARGGADHGHDAYAIQEALDGKVVEWMEKVSDEQYHA